MHSHYISVAGGEACNKAFLFFITLAQVFTLFICMPLQLSGFSFFFPTECLAHRAHPNAGSHTLMPVYQYTLCK